MQPAQTTQADLLHSPYAIVTIPAIGRVLFVLQRMARTMSQRTFQISNRKLAKEAGCKSASGIPAILRQLDSDGHISYDSTISTVMVDAPIDAAIDLSDDRPPVDHVAPAPSSETSDLLNDRVKQSCMVHEYSKSQESVSEARNRAENPFPEDLEWPAWEELQVYPWVYQELRERFPKVTLAEFTFWCEHYKHKNNPAAYVVKLLQLNVRMPVQRTHAPPVTSKRTRGRKVPAAGPMPPAQISQEQIDREAWAWQHMADICAISASDLDKVEIVNDLLDGFSDDQALARLAARRQAGAP